VTGHGEMVGPGLAPPLRAKQAAGADRTRAELRGRLGLDRSRLRRAPFIASHVHGRALATGRLLLIRPANR
jgi:hypothetical protein